MYPTIVNAVGTGETPLALFGFAVPIFSYADSVFPVIFGVIGLSFVYRAIDKVVPDLFKLVVVPALSLAIVIPVNLFVLAPIGAWCGLGLANGIVWLFSTLGPVAGFLLGFFMPLIVLFACISQRALSRFPISQRLGMTICSRSLSAITSPKAVRLLVQPCA